MWGVVNWSVAQLDCRLTFFRNTTEVSYACYHLTVTSDSDPLVPIPCGKENKETYWVALSSLKAMLCGFGKAALASL